MLIASVYQVLPIFVEVSNHIEALICYGLFYIVDPHQYGGANRQSIPEGFQTIARFFKRTPSSLLSKMLNLDGSREHCAREEPLLFAQLSVYPSLYLSLYKDIIETARDLAINETVFPDFLNVLSDGTTQDMLLGQDDLPTSNSEMLKDAEGTLQEIEQKFTLGEILTEKLVEQKIRLTQHQFAVQVLANYGRTCVFCGFEPRTLPGQSELLRASILNMVSI